MNFLRQPFAAALLCLLASACGNGSYSVPATGAPPPVDPPAAVTLERVEVSPTDARIKTRTTQAYSATAVFSDNKQWSFRGESLRWLRASGAIAAASDKEVGLTGPHRSR